MTTPYDHDFYKNRDNATRHAASCVLSEVLARMPMPRSAVDVGCGVGTWLSVLADKGVVVGDKTYEAGTHVPVLIFPNPLNLQKYVVINSGFTFREYDYLNNARQVSKLPDFAVVDITTPVNSRYPGKIVRAGFFSEQWGLPEKDGK